MVKACVWSVADRHDVTIDDDRTVAYSVDRDYGRTDRRCPLKDWLPERLREARGELRDHGRPVSQQQFAAMVGVSKRTLERYENLTDPQPPKPAALAAIVRVTGHPVEFFFTQDPAGALPHGAGGPPTFEDALAQMFARAVEEATRPLQARLELLERQQEAEGWHGTTLTTTRRAA